MRQIKYKIFFIFSIYKKLQINTITKYKRRLRKEDQNLSKEEKDKSWKKVHKKYQHLPEEKRQVLLEYMNNYLEYQNKLNFLIFLLCLIKDVLIFLFYSLFFEMLKNSKNVRNFLCE